MDWIPGQMEMILLRVVANEDSEERVALVWKGTASRGIALALVAIVTYVSLKENMDPVLFAGAALSEVAVA